VMAGDARPAPAHMVWMPHRRSQVCIVAASTSYGPVLAWHGLVGAGRGLVGAGRGLVGAGRGLVGAGRGLVGAGRGLVRAWPS
jgi:hypothetical protein